MLFLNLVFMDVQCCFGISCNCATIAYVKNKQRQIYHSILFICPGLLQSIVFTELDLPL